MCAVRAVCFYLDATSSLTPRPCSLFVSPRCPSRALSKNALSYFLRQVISDAGAIWDVSVGAPRAHSVRGVVTLAAFLQNWSISKVLKAATWRSNPVFASFYLENLSFNWIIVTLSALLLPRGLFFHDSSLCFFRVCVPFIFVRGLLRIRRYLPLLTFMSSVRLTQG